MGNSVFIQKKRGKNTKLKTNVGSTELTNKNIIMSSLKSSGAVKMGEIWGRNQNDKK